MPLHECWFKCELDEFALKERPQSSRNTCAQRASHRHYKFDPSFTVMSCHVTCKHCSFCFALASTALEHPKSPPPGFRMLSPGFFLVLQRNVK